jgi:hypothetical protein
MQPETQMSVLLYQHNSCKGIFHVPLHLLLCDTSVTSQFRVRTVSEDGIMCCLVQLSRPAGDGDS